MKDNYPKAYKEVIEILKYLPDKSVRKIPIEMIKTFETKMDKNYNFNVDINKSFEEQNILEETKAIFANIFRDYWATPYQKDKIEAKEEYDRKKLEEEKRAKYNPDEMFKNNKNAKTEYSEKNNNLPVEFKKTNFLISIIEFFKNLLKRK